jgi:starch synthase
MCKKLLLHEMGLRASLQDRPLLGMVSRLDKQKGLDLLVDILDGLISLEAGLVILGSGDEGIQQTLQKAAERYRGQVAIKIGFHEDLAHRIIAGADMLLIPSRYEPCGLTQMYALKYGTIPIVRATGGLQDSIVHFDPARKKGNGFKFTDHDSKAFLSAVQEAIRVFHEPKSWAALLGNGMKADFSWERSAKKYLELYRSVAAI